MGVPLAGHRYLAVVGPVQGPVCPNLTRTTAKWEEGGGAASATGMSPSFVVGDQGPAMSMGCITGRIATAKVIPAGGPKCTFKWWTSPSQNYYG